MTVEVYLSDHEYLGRYAVIAGGHLMSSNKIVIHYNDSHYDEKNCTFFFDMVTRPH